MFAPERAGAVRGSWQGLNLPLSQGVMLGSGVWDNLSEMAKTPETQRCGLAPGTEVPVKYSSRRKWGSNMPLELLAQQLLNHDLALRALNHVWGDKLGPKQTRNSLLRIWSWWKGTEQEVWMLAAKNSSWKQRLYLTFNILHAWNNTWLDDYQVN